MWNVPECTECSRMFQNARLLFQNVPECMQNVPEWYRKPVECSIMHAECFIMHAECYRMHAGCSRMHAESSRMIQNACRMFKNACRMSQNVPECMQECSRMFQNIPKCMQIHELACSYINLHAVISLNACPSMSLHAVPFFVWAAHKNFVVLVEICIIHQSLVLHFERLIILSFIQLYQTAILQIWYYHVIKWEMEPQKWETGIKNSGMVWHAGKYCQPQRTILYSTDIEFWIFVRPSDFGQIRNTYKSFRSLYSGLGFSLTLDFVIIAKFARENWVWRKLKVSLQT